MSKNPESLSIPEAAKLLSCDPATVCRLVGFVPRTGKEPVPFQKLAEAINCTPRILYDAYAGIDRLLTKPQAAAMLGLKAHCLNVIHSSRPTIIPVAALGQGKGNGLRYSQRAADAHMANPPVKPLPPKEPEPDYAYKVRRYFRNKQSVKRRAA
jgi:hypothetical protein